MAIDVGPWCGLVLGDRIAEGARNEVRVGERDGQRVIVRRSRRPADSLRWELELLVELSQRGFNVPVPIPTDAGLPSAVDVVVQPWVAGRPPTDDDDWRAVAEVLCALHRGCGDIDQRPGCRVVTALDETSLSADADLRALPSDVARRVLGVFADADGAPVSLVHGDPGPSNIRIGDDGEVWLLDWDESRIDVTWLDLSNLGVQVLEDELHGRARRLADAWEAANAWVLEPEYARMRLARLGA